MEEQKNLISGKYFILEADNRFPLTLPTGEWQNLTNKSFNSPTGCSIYLLSGHNNLYVGSDKAGNRPYDHRDDLKGERYKNQYMQNVANKYGLEVFYYQPLIEISQEFVQFRNEIENSYIKLFDTYHNGYNLAEFANAPFLGRKWSLSQRAKICESLIGNKHTLGKNVHTEESKRKIGEFHAKEFQIVSPEGIVICGKNLNKFAKQNNLHSSNLTLVIQGKIKYYHGWRMVKKENLCPFIEVDGKKFELVSPLGEVFRGENISQFAKKNNLNISNLCEFVRGKKESYKGWKKYIPEKMEVDCGQ